MSDFNGKKRSELPDEVFGIPQERKYPMPDEKHTRSAIKLFNHVDPKYEEQLAKAVIKNMKKYNIDGSVVGPNNRLRKYLPKDMIKEYVEEACKDLIHARKLCNAVRKLARKYNANYFFVTDGASSYSNGNGKYNPAAKEMRDHMDDWERNNGFNPDDDWTNDINNVSNYRLLKESSIPEEIPKDMIKESSVLEGLLKSDKDIYYNKGKFDSGEINLCFITGLSGSGKSTMGRGMSSKDIEHYEMDDIICNYAFSDDNLKEYGGLVESFFKGPGKEYRLKRGDEDHNNAVFDSHENYEKEITQLFVKHAISYCKSHKGIKYVCDGIWIFMFIKPGQLKDCAVYIKGTSSIKSGYRALKRDIDEDKRNGMTSLQIFKHEFKRVKEDILYARENQKELKSFISYFEKQLTNESYLLQESSHKSDFSYTGIKTSTEKSEFKRDFREVFKEDPTESSINYMQMIKYKGSLVGYIGFSRYKEGKKKYLGIGNFMIIKRYQHSGIGSKVISDIIDRYKDNYDEIYCYVDKDNTSAIAFYKKIAKVNTDNLTKYGYYVTLYSKSIGESSMNEQKDDSVLPILELQRRLSKFKYGVPINGKIKNASEIDFGKEYKTLTSKEFEKYEAGVCWDFANYQEIELAKMYGKSSIQNYYFIVDKEPNYPTHTITVIKIGSYFYYPEASWGKMMGVYRDKSISHILNTVAKKLADEAGSAEYVECRKYSSYDRLSKLSPIEYMNKMNTMPKVQVSLKESKLQKVTKDNINESVSILPQDTGISTIVFDIGNVLVSTNFKELLMGDPEIPNEIVDTLLKLWLIDKDDIDGTIDLKTYREIVNKRMGVEFSKYIPKLFKYNIECVNAFDYTIPMIQDLKAKGYKVYYLSNWSAWTHDLLREAGKFEFLKYMDGGLFSYDAGYMKPDPEIYKLFIEKYKINPEQAVFFDDKEENVLAAKKLGFQAVQFTDHDSSIVYDYLKNNGAIYESIVQNLNEESYNNRSFNYKSIFENSNDITMEKFIFGSKVKVDMNKTTKEIIEAIKPIIFTSKNKQQASRIGLTLKCELEFVNHNTICILVLDGSQDARNSKEARLLLSNIQNDCKSKLVGYISKVTIGDGDEGCLYFTINKRYIEKSRKDLLESAVSEYGATAGTMVGTNQSDSVYIVNYMQNNAFSGYKEPRFGICRKGMKDLHVVGGKYNKFHYVHDLDKFKQEVSDIHVYRYKGKPRTKFFDIIEEMGDNDLDLYRFITGKQIMDRSDIKFDGNFIEEECFLYELDAIKSCTEASLISESEDLHAIPILNESVVGRPYNYYRDINGVFIHNEITNIRSKSYKSIEDIPESECNMVKRGYII